MSLDITLSFYLAAALAVVMTGISKSGFAGGLGTLAVPIISLFVSPQLAVTIMIPILVVIDLANIWHYRKHWSRRVLWMLMPGALVGLLVGAIFFEWVNPQGLKLLVGILALAFAAQFFLMRNTSRAANEAEENSALSIWFTTITGFVSGFASFIAHAGGPPIKGVLLKARMEKSRFVGTNSVYFFLINGIKAFAYGGLGQYSWETFKISLSLFPFLVLGVLLGFFLHQRVDQKLFTTIAYLMLTFSGVKLIYDGLFAAV